jgi:hypothetical protein
MVMHESANRVGGRVRIVGDNHLLAATPRAGTKVDIIIIGESDWGARKLVSGNPGEDAQQGLKATVLASSLRGPG